MKKDKTKKAETTETKLYTAPMYQNEVRLVGYLGDKPETGEGRAVLSVATKNSWKRKNSDEIEESTDWHRVTAWGNLAEAVKALGFAKGDHVQIDGELRSSQYEKTVAAEPAPVAVTIKAWEIRARAIRKLA